MAVRPISVLTLWISEGLTQAESEIVRDGILRPIGNFPESLSHGILAGIILVGRLGAPGRIDALPGGCPYICPPIRLLLPPPPSPPLPLTPLPSLPLPPSLSLPPSLCPSPSLSPSLPLSLVAAHSKIVVTSAVGARSIRCDAHRVNNKLYYYTHNNSSSSNNKNGNSHSIIFINITAVTIVVVVVIIIMIMLRLQMRLFTFIDVYFGLVFL